MVDPICRFRWGQLFLEKNMGLHSYINSEQFMLDFMPVRTGDNTIEWSVIRGRTGKKLIWLNGYLMNVSSAKRVSGTFDEFIEYVSKKLQRVFKNDPDASICKDMVNSFVSDMHLTKIYKGYKKYIKGL